MKFSSKGEFLAAFDFGWDSTPAVVPHDDTYSIVIKDNHYGGIGLYSSDPTSPICAPLPNGPYYITRLNANLQPEWKFKDATTDSCKRNPDRSLTCTPNTHPNGFEWCINAPVIDQEGFVYANSEDGSLYVLKRKGTLMHKLFLNLALGTAYTPLSIGPDGKIYTQNDGHLFVAGDEGESMSITKRAARRLILMCTQIWRAASGLHASQTVFRITHPAVGSLPATHPG